MTRFIAYGMSEGSYNTHLERGKNAPCNGCSHEDYCSTGYTCEMYRKWERVRASVWEKDPKNYTQTPDRPYG